MYVIGDDISDDTQGGALAYGVGDKRLCGGILL